MRLITACLLLLFSQALLAQSVGLRSGPMLGYAEMREVLVWVQTDGPAEVKIGYRSAEGKGTLLFTESYATSKSEAYTAKLVADAVEPGQTYRYDVYLDGQQVSLPYPTTFTTPPIWRWRNDPPPFSVALGSCTYINEEVYDRPGKGYGSEYEIFTAIDRRHPDLMLWLGDNTYLREPDWYTRTGILHRYTHSRAVPEMQPLLARTHHYAIWDDHDYGPNDSDRTWIRKATTTEAFKLFWGNLTFGMPDFGGIGGMFRYNDVDFFLLDNRSFRTPNQQRRSDNKTILGEAQLEWLIESLIFSDASYKMVAIGGQVLNSHRGGENYVNLAPEERAYLLRRIEEEDIRNVIFLTGDRHHTELSAIELAGDNRVYDLTISSLTAGTGTERSELNLHRVEGSLVVQHNFGILRFEGPYRERVLTVTVYDKDGGELWSRVLE